MKRILLSFFAIIAIAMTANAEDFVGTATNLQMGTKHPDDVEKVTFTLNETTNVLSGTVNVPAHEVSITVPLNFDGSIDFSGRGSGTVTMAGIPILFNCTVTQGKYEKGESLFFHCEATLLGFTGLFKFDFESPSPQK